MSMAASMRSLSNTNNINAAFAQIDETLFVIVYVKLVIACLCLDMLVYGHTLDSRPAKSGILDNLLALEDFLLGPYFAIRDMM